MELGQPGNRGTGGWGNRGDRETREIGGGRMDMDMDIVERL